MPAPVADQVLSVIVDSEVKAPESKRPYVFVKYKNGAYEGLLAPVPSDFPFAVGESIEVEVRKPSKSLRKDFECRLYEPDLEPAPVQASAAATDEDEIELVGEMPCQLRDFPDVERWLRKTFPRKTWGKEAGQILADACRPLMRLQP